MDVILDGDRGFQFERAPVDVFAAVASIDESLRRRGRAILSVRADGQSISAQDLIEKLSGRPLSGVGALEIKSEDVGTLVSSCLRELEQAVPDLPRACHDLAAVFHGSSPEEGYESFRDLADIWGNVKAREIQVSKLLDLKLEAVQIDGSSVAEMHRELNMHLKEAAHALETGDCVLLGDLLEYELAPRAEMERRIVAILKAHAKGRDG